MLTPESPAFEKGRLEQEDRRMTSHSQRAMLRSLIAILVVVFTVMGTTALETPPETKEVTLPQGVVEGARESTGGDDERFFYSFRGIPYASPPVGDLRFKEPEPAEPWSGVRKTEKPPACLQPNIEALFKNKLEINGEEDCLYLNVFTSMPSEDESLPVMVFIHGGGFLLGNAETFGGNPVPLLNHNIVLVVIQYRLGTLGFMSTEDSALPGNLGMQDQTFALKWVQENIHKFGGNPKKVTIFGESAGSASVDYHILSPYSKGLFHRAILQSGTALCPWAFREDHAERSLSMAKKFDCPGTEDFAANTNEIVQCLKEQSAEDLTLAACDDTFNGMPFYMVPRLDGDYIPRHPAQLLMNGEYNKVDIMAGVCQNEGISVVKMIFGNETLANHFENHFDEVVIPLAFSNEKAKGSYFSRLAAYHYAGDIKLNKETLEGYEKFFSDSFMNIGHDESTSCYGRDRTYGKHTYRYELQLSPELSFGDIYNVTMPFEGEETWVSHGDDLQFLFNGVYGFPASTRDDVTFLSNIMTTLWVNFAKTGNPTPDLELGFKWEPMESADDLRYLSLTPSPKMKEDNRAENREFWKNIPLKSNKILFPERFTCDAETC